VLRALALRLQMPVRNIRGVDIILFALHYPEVVRDLLFLRVTGGSFVAGRLRNNYYGKFIRAAQEGGMAALVSFCESGQ
jgi:hypothetical protein